jgi:rod shape-determining protein MreB and related proteins
VFSLFTNKAGDRRWRPVTGIAIDLGTGNTLVHVKGRGMVLNEPSVVAVQRGTNKIEAVGTEAKKMLGRTPEGIRAIRPLKDGVIADVDVTEMMLRYFLEKVMSEQMLKTKPRMIVGVPSGITELERRAVRTSATAAGAKEVYMLSEPMAAAIGVGLPVNEATGSMVIDIGGGTTEIAVIALGGIVSDASIRVAGDEIDAAIVTHMRKHYNLMIGDSTAEQVKIGLASAVDMGENLSLEVKGRDMVNGIPKTVTVHQAEIREAISEPIQQIVDATRRCLEVTPPELAGDIVDNGIVLTGGGALIRGLDVLLQRETGIKIRVDDDPLTCVARGAARVLEDFDTYQSVCAT